MDFKINYKNIARAIEYFEQNGYEYVDVDWMADKDAVGVTLPKDCDPHELCCGVMVSDRYLVGSGEQSFIDLAMQQKLQPGKYVCATPCFRDDAEDELHHEYFFKVELFHYITPIKTSGSKSTGSVVKLGQMIELCGGFFNQEIKCRKVKLEPFKCDIVDSQFGIELGSYGISSHHLVGEWVYGTGYAEPRFSVVKDKIARSKNE